MEDYPTHQDAAPVEEPKKATLWSKIGGGALTFAIIFHIILLLIGALWIFQIVRPPEKTVDFLPGNGERGGGERSAQTKVQQKKRAQITPTTNVKRVFAENAISTFAIPEQGDDFGQTSALSNLGGGGSLGGGLGGSGGGQGFGVGPGSGLGTNGLGIKMFGLELEGTARIGVVMDVSRSMTKYLPKVTRELDKLPSTAPLILYFGCGIAPEPKNNSRSDERLRLTTGPQFDKFWYAWQGKDSFGEVKKNYDKLRVDPKKDKMPLEAIYKEMANRPDTYFLEFNGIQYTQPALLASELKDVDTIYWFADFQDKAEKDEMEDVLRKLKSRRQKLIIHAPSKGRNFDAIKEGIAVPSGGQAIFKPIN